MVKPGLKNKTVSIILVLFIALFALPQSALTQTENNLNYPALISVKYKDGSVLINFEPVGGEKSRYKIYRSDTPIVNKKELQKAVPIAEITEQKLPYKDAPDEDGKYQYAVTAIRNGKEYTELVPFQNITINPVDYSPNPDPVQSINVYLLEKHLVGVSFTPTEDDYTYSLYVSSRKISEIADNGPFSVLPKNIDHFEVQVEEETPYYFFVSTSNRLDVENKKIIPSKNSTTHPFIIKKPKKKKPPAIKKKKKPVVVSPGKLIENNLRNNFYTGKYTTALEVFQDILEKYKLSPSQRGTSHFYIGQCYYYKGNYETAVRYFILSKEIGMYKEKAELWIDRCLERVH